MNDHPDPNQFSVAVGTVDTRMRHRNPDFERYSYGIREPWSIAVMPDLSYAFVCDLNSKDVAQGMSNPGANVGIVRDPFGLRGTPWMVAATTPIEGGWADTLALSPDGSRLFVNYGGVGEILVMDAEQMITTVETKPSLDFMQKPLDQIAGVDIHITPITHRGWVGGFSMQSGLDESTPEIEIESKLLYKDRTSFKIRLANPAHEDRVQAPVKFVVTWVGQVNEFLTDEFGRDLPPSLEIYLPLGGERTLEFHTKNLLDDIRSIEIDQLFGARINVEAWSDHLTGFGMMLAEQHAYVYRYVDAADDHHEDRKIEMADTTNDGEQGVKRVRSLDMRMADELKPLIAADSVDHFYFDENSSEFQFDPTATALDLSTIAQRV